MVGSAAHEQRARSSKAELIYCTTSHDLLEYLGRAGNNKDRGDCGKVRRARRGKSGEEGVLLSIRLGPATAASQRVITHDDESMGRWVSFSGHPYPLPRHYQSADLVPLRVGLRYEEMM